jgi:RNA polymerase sigma factor (TIGR02999 family)
MHAAHEAPPGAVTALLRRAGAGEPQAADQLFALVYDELRRLADAVRRGRAGDTLSSTALVHEAYLRLVPAAGRAPHDRAHFFALAARAMRHVLVDAARERLAAKRGGGGPLVTLDEGAAAVPAPDARLVALDEALRRLAALDARQARVVEYRYFAGLTAEEAGLLLGVSAPTVKRDWRAARAWLAAGLDDA